MAALRCARRGLRQLCCVRDIGRGYLTSAGLQDEMPVLCIEHAEALRCYAFSWKGVD